MNMQNLLSQMMNAKNPMQMLMGMIPQNQQGLVSQFQGMNKQEQAERIAKICNEKGITKDQLASIINGMRK